jgi:hypothetical protein
MGHRQHLTSNECRLEADAWPEHCRALGRAHLAGDIHAYAPGAALEDAQLKFQGVEEQGDTVAKPSPISDLSCAAPASSEGPGGYAQEDDNSR